MIGRPAKQINFLDSVFSNRKKRARTDALLQKVNQLIDWSFLVEMVEKTYKPSRRGRPSIPMLYMIKILFLQYLYNLSDPSLEDALIDRLSFQRFVGFSFTEEVPDFTTIWRFRDRLVKAGIIDRLFVELNEMLERHGKELKRGQITIADATLVDAARRAPKDGDRSCQRDYDARMTKKGKRVYYGYKGYIGVDRATGLIHHASFTPANVHDSQELDNLLTGREEAIFADKAYDSAVRKRSCRKKGVFYGIQEKGDGIAV